MKKLQRLKASEVSLVQEGANRKRFMIFKGADGTAMSINEELQAAIAKADPEMVKAVAVVIDKHVPKDGTARTVIQAMSRIAHTLKGKISPAVMHEAVDAVGFKLTDDGEGEGATGGAGATSVGEAPAHGEKIEMGMQSIPTEHLAKATECAQKAYDEQLAKLGYQMYPEAQVQMKSKSGEPAKPKEDDVSKGAPAQLDAETQAKLDSIFKANEDITKANADLVKQNQELRTEISALQNVNKQRELVQKAASFTSLGLPQEMIVQTLADAQKAGTEAYDRVVKQYEMLVERERVAKSFGGNLFGERGSSLPGGAGGAESTWSKIEKAAEGFVQKSAFTGTREQAIAKFLETSEGTRLYAEHQAARKDGI